VNYNAIMSVNTPKTKVPTLEMIESFAFHIADATNKRIMFSAPFGAGKSTFLEEFFSVHSSIKRITINPVDYSVSSNEDILEIIKYDILYELTSNFEKEINLKQEDFDNLLLAQVYAKDKLKILPLLKLFTSIIPGVEVAEQVEDMKADFDTFAKEMHMDETEIVKKYLAAHKLKKGSIREADEITVLIKDFILRIKNIEEIKQIVLVIDDLDRLDPEHAFRLFNVFTAHYDSRTEENKFDFDRIIFVCDIENVRHMFHHKFGYNVDFTGYIDKFYSNNIFEFNFKKYLKQQSHLLFTENVDAFGMYFESCQAPHYIYQRYSIHVTRSNFAEVLLYIVSELINENLLKMRNFRKFRGYSVPVFEFSYANGRTYKSYDFPLLVLFHILRQFYPTYIDLLEVLKKLSSKFVEDNRNEAVGSIEHTIINILIGYAAIFLLKDEEFSDHIETGIKRASVKNKNEDVVDLALKFDRVDLPKCLGVFHPGVVDVTNVHSQSKPDPYHYLQLALQKLLKQKVIE